MVPKYKEERIVRKHGTKESLNTSWTNSKPCIFMPDVKGLFRSPTLFLLDTGSI